MNLTYKNITIRNALESDAELLSLWWNDGKVMAHAGFPNGIGKTINMIKESLKQDDDATCRHLIIEYNHQPIGEMHYRNESNRVASIGIKICDFSQQERGLGRIVLSMLIAELYYTLHYQKIILDTNLLNTRAQHVYELLGFTKTAVSINSWQNQLGEWQSKVDYELVESHFNNFTLKS